jgi:putative tryptophan/tyrosine transport system substrate-binding protein
MDRRRLLVTSLASALAVPLVTQAQPAGLPLVAILQSTSASEPPGGIPHFKQALANLGWIEDRTIRFEMRYGDWQADRIIAAAHELVRLRPNVLYTNSAPAVRALMQATTTIPIVVGAVSDLVALGVVTSLARPGGNVTGVTHAQAELDRKRLEVLKETAPAATRMAYLFDPGAVADVAFLALEESARLLNVRITRADARTPNQIEAARANA